MFLTLGKELICRVFYYRHYAKSFFDECFFNTRQRQFKSFIMQIASMIRWFQIKKLSMTKFHYISRTTTFIFVVFPFEVDWKIQILKFKHSFALQDNFKPKHCQLQSFITFQCLQLFCWWFFHSRSFSKFKFF
jgi:hypothetical protein